MKLLGVKKKSVNQRRRKGIDNFQVEPLEGKVLLTASVCDRDHGDDHAHALYAPGSVLPEGPEEYVQHGSQWPQPDGNGTTVTITYSFSNLLDGNLGGDLSLQQLNAVISEGFALWALCGPFNFVQVTDSGPPVSDTSYSAGTHPDIRIGHHSIDGASNVLAHAYYPTGSGLAGDIHFDTAENWTVGDNTGANVDILETFVHELGHALGLRHETTNPAIMAPVHSSRFTGLGTSYLLQDDIVGIRAIYGPELDDTDPDDQIIEAISVDLDSTRYGIIDNEHDVDMFAITVEALQTVTFKANTPESDLDPRIRLFGPNGVGLAGNDDRDYVGHDYDSELTYTFTTGGTYYLGVATSDNPVYNPVTGDEDAGVAGPYTSGIYELIVTAEGFADPDDEFLESTYVNWGSTTNGNIDHENDVDMFDFVVGAGQRMIFEMNTPTSELDPEIRLFNTNGTLLDFNDNRDSSGGDHDSELTYTFVTAGTYFLGVAAFNNDDYNPITGHGDNGSANPPFTSGAYQLVVTPDGIVDFDDQISEAIPLAIGSTLNGEINPDTRDVDMYSFVATAGSTLDFDVDETDGDLIAIARIFDANGTQLASGGNDESALSYTFGADGTYYVGVSDVDNVSYNPIDGTGDTIAQWSGSYNLTISRPQGSYVGSDVFAQIGGDWWVTRSNGNSGFTNLYYGAWDPNAGWSNVQTGDFNNDGLTDVVGRNNEGQLWVGVNTGSSFDIQLWGYLVPSLGIESLMVADVDGNGDDDIVGRSSTGHWWVAISNGFSGFTNELWGGWVESAGWSNVMVADLNGDGKMDIIGQANNGQWWAAQSNGSAFTTEYWGSWVPTLGWQDVQVADIDSDGDSDLVGRTSTGAWWVARSNGSDSFANEWWGGWVESAGWDNVMVTDLDGDGNQDVIGQSTNGQWWAARSNGFSFTTEYWGYWVPSGWQDVQVIDVDQDGNIDVVGRDSGGALWIARSNGSTEFTNEIWGGLVAGNWTSVMVGNAGSGASAVAAIVDNDDDEKSTLFS